MKCRCNGAYFFKIFRGVHFQFWLKPYRLLFRALVELSAYLQEVLFRLILSSPKHGVETCTQETQSLNVVLDMTGENNNNNKTTNKQQRQQRTNKTKNYIVLISLYQNVLSQPFRGFYRKGRMRCLIVEYESFVVFVCFFSHNVLFMCCECFRVMK